MPTYVYSCKKCGEFDIQQSIKDDTLTVCPKCGGKDIKKVISTNVGFVFKGSGFYTTDYKRKEEKQAVPEGCKGCEKAKECGKE